MFAAYRQLDDTTFIEVTGVGFEEFEAGQVFEHRPGRTITLEECRKHVMHAIDLSARHLDDVYNALVHGRHVVPEILVLTIVAVGSTKTFGRVVANLGWTNTVMHSPVYVGDTIYSESEIIGKRESASRPDQGIMHVATRGFNQHGARVCSTERRFLVYKTGQGPYQAAGY